MKIKRTYAGYQTKSFSFVADYWGYSHPVATQAMCDEIPTHSSILGPDGAPLQYEARQAIGFDLTPGQTLKAGTDG